jgi:hypothetical protein
MSPAELASGAQRMDLTHLAIAVGSEQLVDELTQRIKDDGYPVLDGRAEPETAITKVSLSIRTATGSR